MQNIIKKCLYLFLVTVFFMNVTIVFAAPQEISAEGQYRLGDTDTRDKAKKAALADAKRKIIEQAGVFVESYTEVNNFHVTQDQIRTAASAMIKVKSESVDFYENGTLCKAFIVATVDTDNIGKYLKDMPKTITSKKLHDYEELNGHYYKIFNEGVSWQQANKRCKDIGGHLVTITSELEQSIIQKLIVINGIKNNYWIGGFKGNTGNWQWITGERFSYANWAIGEPNNANGHEDAIMVFRNVYPNSLVSVGSWNDLSSDGILNLNDTFYGVKNTGFICEWDSAEDIIAISANNESIKS